MNEYTDFVDLIANSLRKNWDLDALTDYKGVTLQYKDVARKLKNSTFCLKMPELSKATRLPFVAVIVLTGLQLFWQY